MTFQLRGANRFYRPIRLPGARQSVHDCLGPAVAPPQGRPAGAMLPAAPSRRDRVDGAYARIVKRGLDIGLSSLAILLSLPVLLLLIVALWLEGGSPLYSQLRLGKDGKRFRMLKLRSMVPGAEAKLAACLAADPRLRAEWELTQKLKNDPRITRLGRFLRMTSLDELPQLFNVLKGDMSMIGPRPMLPEQLPLYLHPSAYLAVRPGISGLWQVTARNSDSFATRAQIDKTYVETLSPRGDMQILLATAGAVLRGTGY